MCSPTAAACEQHAVRKRSEVFPVDRSHADASWEPRASAVVANGLLVSLRRAHLVRRYPECAHVQRPSLAVPISLLLGILDDQKLDVKLLFLVIHCVTTQQILRPLKGGHTADALSQLTMYNNLHPKRTSSDPRALARDCHSPSAAVCHHIHRLRKLDDSTSRGQAWLWCCCSRDPARESRKSRVISQRCAPRCALAFGTYLTAKASSLSSLSFSSCSHFAANALSLLFAAIAAPPVVGAASSSFAVDPRSASPVRRTVDAPCDALISKMYVMRLSIHGGARAGSVRTIVAWVG